MKKNGRGIIIEAIPPILKFNFLGKFIRSLDQGHFIRSIEAYEKPIGKKFNIVYSKKLLGGIVDYALIVISN